MKQDFQLPEFGVGNYFFLIIGSILSMSYDNIMVLCSLLFLTAYNNYFSVCTYVCVLVLMLLVSICWSLDVVDGRCPDTGLCVQGWSIRQVWLQRDHHTK